jgi:ribosomal protein S18 acetylase RimI-like enzyme
MCPKSKQTNAGTRKRLMTPRLVSVTVRRFTPDDFEFVRSLAASIAGYTICPSYVLWMLSRVHPDFCAVAVTPDGKRVGYLLAMSMDEPGDAVFVWQLAVTFHGRRLRAQDRLAAHLKESLKERRNAQIFFTTVPHSAADRSIRALAKRVFGGAPCMSEHLPDSVSTNERVYRLALVAPRTKTERG